MSFDPNGKAVAMMSNPDKKEFKKMLQQYDDKKN